MSKNQSTERRSGDAKSKLLEQLHDPVRLRVCVIAAVLAAGYVAIYSPMYGKIVDTTKELKREKNMLALATKMEGLQKQYDKFKDRIPEQTDSKEWVQYMLDGIRRFPLELARFDCREPSQVGPYQAITLKIELEGSFMNMDKFLRWLETNPRLLRVDEMTVAPARSEDADNVLRLTILGLSS